MFNPNPEEIIWINDHWGPKKGKFLMSWPAKGKVLIECDGSPSIVDLDNCFVDPKDCFAAAAAKKQEEAMAAMKVASKYSAAAAGKVPLESE